MALSDGIVDERKTELKFALNNFNQPDTVTELPGVAQKFLNLLLTKPGTYPDHPDLGVDIEQYQFDFLDEKTCTKIEDRIRKQVDTYMPDSGISMIIVRPQTDPATNRNTILGIAVSITNNGALEEFFMYLDKEGKKEMQISLQF